jgi:hypothetical protein
MKSLSKILVCATALIAVGCTSEGNESQEGSEDAVYTAKLTEEQARELSPVGEICVTGSIEEIFVPANRGRGNNNGEWVTVDNRVYEPAFLRGDVNYDGQVGTREDAMLGTKNIYVKQIENELCSAVADIGIFPQGLGSDSFFTAEDIYQWNQVKKTGEYKLGRELICQSDCAVINHLAPGFKHQ